MTAYKLKLRPGGIIPPAVELGIVLKRAPVIAEERIVLPIVPPQFPKGTDRWYDALDDAKIAWRAYTAQSFPATPNYKDGAGGPDEPFSSDDDSAFEGDVPGAYFPNTPARSAWWAIQVPPGSSGTLDADFFQSLPAGGSSLSPTDPNVPDLYMNVFTTDAAIPTDPLPTDELDFDTMYEIANAEDVFDPITGKNYLPAVVGVPLESGKTYWIRVDLWSPTATPDDDVDYVLRITLTLA